MNLTELNLIRDIYYNVKNHVELEINLFHLGKDENFLDTNNYLINDYSIIVIQPSWLINVTDFTSLDFCERHAITGQFSKSPVNDKVFRGNCINQTLKGRRILQILDIYSIFLIKNIN